MAHCRKHDWKDLRTTNISESCCKACDPLARWGKTTAENMRRVVMRIADKYDRVHFWIRGRSNGIRLASAHHILEVMNAPLLRLPIRKPGDRVKTNRRGALTLAKILCADELTAVWVQTKAVRLCGMSFAPARANNGSRKVRARSSGRGCHAGRSRQRCATSAPRARL